jgi:branched-chain amino acid transport system ATP-binding protein
MTVLSCEKLSAGYGGKAVVRDLDLTIEPGEVLALLGPNGAGKTTLLLTIAGLLPAVGGSVRHRDVETTRLGAAKTARRGVVLVPDDRSLFTTLTVRENLALARRKGSLTEADITAYFPQLESRLRTRAGSLSGGEQQMLAVGRALMQQADVLLIDELSMGLAPMTVQRLLPVVRTVAQEIGTAVILVEQHVHLALQTADRACVLVHGRIALEDTAARLIADQARLEQAYFGTPDAAHVPM